MVCWSDVEMVVWLVDWKDEVRVALMAGKRAVLSGRQWAAGKVEMMASSMVV
jgi:hypothetical protein